MNEWANKQVNGIDWHYLVKWNETTQNEVKLIIASMNEMVTHTQNETNGNNMT
jgi:hypothetical protein